MIKLKLQNVIIGQKDGDIMKFRYRPAPLKKNVIYNDIDGFTEIGS